MLKHLVSQKTESALKNKLDPKYDSDLWITEEVDLSLGKAATKICLPKFCHVNLTQDDSFVSNISKPLLYLQRIPLISNYCLAIFTNRVTQKQSQIICKVQYCPILQCAYVSGKMRVTKQRPVNNDSPLKFYNQQDFQNQCRERPSTQANNRKIYSSGTSSSNKDSNYISTRSNSTTSHLAPRNTLHSFSTSQVSPNQKFEITSGTQNTLSGSTEPENVGIGKSKTSLFTCTGLFVNDRAQVHPNQKRPVSQMYDPRSESASPQIFDTQQHKNTSNSNRIRDRSPEKKLKSKNQKSKRKHSEEQSEKFCFELRLTRKITNADRYLLRHLWKGHLYIGKNFSTIEPAFEAHVPMDFCID